MANTAAMAILASMHFTLQYDFCQLTTSDLAVLDTVAMAKGLIQLDDC